jgi:cytochrome d ubiquinol oxidase subunit I
MNWSQYSRFVGNVFGSLLAPEGVFAFFLESGFLGLMLFGGDRLGSRMWLAATVLVVFGAHFSALWILVANSWMQTRRGFEQVGIPFVLLYTAGVQHLFSGKVNLTESSY